MKLLYVVLTLILLLSLASAVNIQSGAIVQNSQNNTGIQATIQTMPQNVSVQEESAWIGETLTDNSFLQVGYMIPNQTGFSAHETCFTDNSSEGTVSIVKGQPMLFWEWFDKYEDTCEYLVQYPLDKNTYHTYAIKSIGSEWYLTVDNITIGMVKENASTAKVSSIVFEEVSVKENVSDSFALNNITQVNFTHTYSYRYNGTISNGSLIPYSSGIIKPVYGPQIDGNRMQIEDKIPQQAQVNVIQSPMEQSNTKQSILPTIIGLSIVCAGLIVSLYIGMRMAR